MFICFLNCDYIFPIKFKPNQIIWNSQFREFEWKLHWKSLRWKAYRSNKVNQLMESQSLKNFEWEDFLSVLPSKHPSIIRPSIYPSKGWLAGWLWRLAGYLQSLAGWLGGLAGMEALASWKAWLAGWEAWMAGSESWLGGLAGWLGGLAGSQRGNGQMYLQTYVWMDGRT